MIEQYLSNTNKKVTVFILQNILELNKAYGDPILNNEGYRPCLVPKS